MILQLPKMNKQMPKLLCFCRNFVAVYLINLPEAALSEHIILGEIVRSRNNISKANKWKIEILVTKFIRRAQETTHFLMDIVVSMPALKENK